MKFMVRGNALGISLVLFSTTAATAAVTSPATQDNVASADDYATRSFQDPWDMTERTDLGWFTFEVMPPADTPSFLTNFSFSGGIFSAQTLSDDPQVTLLDTALPETAFLGKIGANFPINANFYTVLSFRMRLNGNGFGVLIWSKNTLFGGVSASGAFPVIGGWHIYRIAVPTLGTVLNGAGSWSGLIDSLRFDPTNQHPESIQIDWVRLVNDVPSLDRTITWTGGAPVDIYLDNDSNPGNGNLGTIARNVSGGSFTFNVGSLPRGDYYVAVANTGTSNFEYSPGFYRVNDIPTLRFLSPSEEGSDDDFATAQLGNPWDMNNLSDVDFQAGNSNLGITTANPVQDMAGNSIGPVNVLEGLSAPSAPVGDPRIYVLHWTLGAARGATTPIDSDRYRILVWKMGIPGNRDITPDGGSVARVIWRVEDDPLGENVSQDIIVQGMEPTLVMNTIIADMKTLAIEPGAGSPSHAGWNGLIDGFRLDAHEFTSSRTYDIQSVKLASFENATKTYTIRWSYNDILSNGPSLDLYYDNDRVGFNGTQIASGLDPTIGEYTWDSVGVTPGEYFIYAMFLDGRGNSNRVYSRWPVVVNDYVCMGSLDLDLMGQVINTTEVYEACQTITAGPSFTVVSPGNVTFRAGTSVILENGFAVMSGAALTIEIDPSL
ncbi:MAG TPA: Ser-Thr-rich GPI-anchored membrane family protein [Vicinamibacteria bacterium]|nr:Ser-Thr-rich GPI-anchored membrane family protein [Vicinamibacteria bacterium]